MVYRAHMKKDKKENSVAWVRELMKGKPEEEILEAIENLKRYVELVAKIAERLEDQEAKGICHIEDYREGQDETNCELCKKK
jgi:hypothetical protein